MKRDEVLTALAVQPITRDVLQEKYLKPGENDFEDLFARVARALASVEKPKANGTSGRPCSTPTCGRARSAPAAS